MGEAERYPWEGVPAGVPCFHIHHNRLLEWSTEPLDVRARYVREEKPAREVEARLRLMRPVAGELPAEVVEARRAVDEARRAHGEARRALDEAERARDEAGRALDEAGRVLYGAWRAHGEALRAWDKARRALDEAVERHLAEVEALHAAECPGCPWNGKTIFPELEDVR